MDAAIQSTAGQQSSEESSRFRSAVFLQRAEEIGFWWQSPRQVARQLGVPDSSFRFHLRRREQLTRDPGLTPSLVRFLESPTGVQFLHRLLVALHLVFGLANDCGLRNIGWFLRLSGLDKFLPASYGAQQAFAAKLETRLVEFGQAEEQRLAAQMPHREISLCADETFHPQICLVAMEPVSNYLVLEQYAPQRDADTWRQCLDDEQRDQLLACQEQCPQSTHVAELQRQVAQATAAETEARQRLAACQQRQRQATEARHGLSHDYHPIDLETSRPVTASEVEQRLSGHFDRPRSRFSGRQCCRGWRRGSCRRRSRRGCVTSCSQPCTWSEWRRRRAPRPNVSGSVRGPWRFWPARARPTACGVR